VENAVRHGIGKITGPGEILIRADREGDDVHIEVRDNGPGPSGAPRKGGVGLANTRSRLQHLYGESGRLVFGPGASGGTTVTITIPFRVRETPSTQETEPLVGAIR